MKSMLYLSCMKKFRHHNSSPAKKKLSEKEWKKIWEDMKRISKLGKQGVNLTESLRRDRDTHF